MEKIEVYILHSKVERQAHLRLDESCDERGGMSSYFKGLLAYHLDTSIPSGRKVHVCHACHNGKCSNVNHLYWGTPRDNRDDAVANGKPASPYYAMLAKYGPDKTREIMSNASKGNKGGCGNAGNSLSESHKQNISRSLTGKKNTGGGRKPSIEPTLLLKLIEENGFEGTAKYLNKNIDAVKSMYYRVMKKQK